MKILRLRLKGFLGVKESDLDLSRDQNLLHGPNGSGKTSHLDATRWCLWGRCRGTDAAGRGAVVLIKGGSELAAVCLDLRAPDGTEYEVLRMQRGTSQTLQLTCPDGTTLEGERAQARIDSVFGSAEIGEICLDGPSFLALDSRAQGSLLAGAIGIRIDRATLATEAAAYGLSETARAQIDEALDTVAGYLDGRPVVGPEQLQRAHDVVFARRKEAKKQAKDLEEDLKRLPTGPLPTPEAIEAARSALAEIGAREATAQETLGTLKGRQREWSAADSRRRELEIQVADLEASARQAQQNLPIGPSIESLTAEVTRLREAHRAAATVESGAQEKRVRAEAEAKAAWERVVQARDGDASCPAHITDDPCPVLLPRVQERKAQVPELQAAAKKADGAATKARTAEKTAATDTEQAFLALERKESELVAAREAAARHQGSNAATWDAIQAELDRIAEQAIENPTAEIVRQGQAIQEIAAQKTEAAARVSRLEEAARSGETRATAERKLAEKTAEVQIAEELVKALDAKGLPAKILEARVGKAEKGLNELLGQITGGQYQVTIEPGPALLFRKADDPYPLPSKLLSPSEQLRVGAAIAMSFALLTPFRCVWIDAADTLLEDLRALLWETLSGLIGVLETSVMGCSMREPCMETSEDVGSFWMEAGSVRMVKALQTEEVAT